MITIVKYIVHSCYLSLTTLLATDAMLGAVILLSWYLIRGIHKLHFARVIAQVLIVHCAQRHVANTEHVIVVSLTLFIM